MEPPTQQQKSVSQDARDRKKLPDISPNTHIISQPSSKIPCIFAFAGCTSITTFKSDWKRHVSTKHFHSQLYTCSKCKKGEGQKKGYNRKDLFTNHLKRKHQIAQGPEIERLQSECITASRDRPEHLHCARRECQKVFKRLADWDEWTEHVWLHVEKGEGCGVADVFIHFALESGIIEIQGENDYRLCKETWEGASVSWAKNLSVLAMVAGGYTGS
ncbi:hypothetical protein BGZ63DRAFT_96180 [Mariannaea sp. PMI_226]|nr:hypothetical protein BGZ63DRAFT_96180 [Mariannaea sp. PMI_226]